MCLAAALKSPETWTRQRSALKSTSRQGNFIEIQPVTIIEVGTGVYKQYVSISDISSLALPEGGGHQLSVDHSSALHPRRLES